MQYLLDVIKLLCIVLYCYFIALRSFRYVITPSRYLCLCGFIYA